MKQQSSRTVIGAWLAVGMMSAYAALAGPSSAHAFTVSGQFNCPDYLRPGSSWRLDATYSSSNRRMIPCSGLVVELWDDDWTSDDLCGLSVTNSSGKFMINADGECDREVYLKIRALNHSYSDGRLISFGVGANDVDWYDPSQALLCLGISSIPGAIFGNLNATTFGCLRDFLTDYNVFEWHTDTRTVPPNNHLDFGSFQPRERSMIVAKIIRSLRRSMDQIAFSGYYQNFIKVIFNNPAFGNPTTIYDVDRTNVISIYSDIAFYNYPLALNALPHEAGHAIYNRLHSSWRHWIDDDAAEYMKQHDYCSQNSRKFAFYEGFADFVQEYIYSESIDIAGASDNFQKFKGCGADNRGMHFEGNVAAMLNYIYHGGHMEDLGTRNPGLYNDVPGQILSLFSGEVINTRLDLPSLGEVFTWIQQQGTRSHSAGDFWNNEIRTWCSSVGPDNFLRYCHPLARAFTQKLFELSEPADGIY